MRERTRQEWYDATLDDYDIKAEYDEMLDDVYGGVEVGSFCWSAARVLAELDPIAYRCGFNDWTDSMAFDAPDEDEDDGQGSD